ncbi:MAG: hypothetical protein M3O34_20120 [Chloroflexota bacterium]|nr:hypothetical protein [Chloroflexota bacterium]
MQNRAGNVPRRFDASEMALRGRIGAYALHARRDPRETTAPARAAFLKRFEREVDPEGALPEVERLRRAECARKAHMARLALASARARAKGRAPKNGDAAVDQTAAAGEEARDDDATVTRSSQ